MGSSFEIGAGESIRHSTLSHFFQIVGQVLIARILVSDFLCQGAQLVVLDRHLFSEGILVLKMHLDLHCVATIEPRCERPLLHPVVHLIEEDVGVALCCHILSVETAHGKEAFSHKADIESVFQVLTTSLVTLGKLLSGTACLVEVEGMTQESISHLLENSL